VVSLLLKDDAVLLALPSAGGRGFGHRPELVIVKRKRCAPITPRVFTKLGCPHVSVIHQNIARRISLCVFRTEYPELRSFTKFRLSEMSEGERGRRLEM
jgi:hypothetical protein